MRALAFFLPPLALLVVTGALTYAALTRQEAPSRGSSPAAEASRSTPPRFQPNASVCQGILHRPDSTDPHVFPDVYTRRIDYKGLTILGTAEVSDRSFAEAKKTIDRTFAHNTLIDPLVEKGAYIVISAPGQGVLDLPEFACLGARLGQNFFAHVCGVADHADYPVVTVNELDLTGDPKGPCQGLNVLYHELGHLVQNFAIGPADYFDIKQFYQDALNEGKYRRQYAATNAAEYFAEGTQAYLLFGEASGGKDRTWLKQYDPRLYGLLEQIYGK